MKKTLLFFLTYLLPLFSAQELDLVKIENEIYRNNREGKHKLSQKKLLNILENKDISAKEQVEINLLMAATFRSINDYASAIHYLKESKEVASAFTNIDSLKANINAEMALAYFDDHQYRESEKIIRKMKKKNFENLDDNYRAYMIMQMGYIHFLRKKYNLAERDYQEAAVLLKKVSACNQPAVWVKQMQLYNAQNRLSEVDEKYRKCSELADSCKILKYKIYATEEIKEIYKKRKDKDKAFRYAALLDSLNNIYQRDQNLSVMHVENQTFQQNQTKLQQNDKIWRTVLYTTALIVVIVIGFSLYKRSMRLKSEKITVQNELQKIKNELKAYSQVQFSNEVLDNDILNSDLLSNHQKELLKLVAQGLTNREIAEKLSVTEATVKYHFRKIYTLLDIKNRREMFVRLTKK